MKGLLLCFALALPLALTCLPASAGGSSEGSELARALYDGGKYPEAADAWRRLLDRSPPIPAEEQAAALYNRGNALYRSADYAHARQEFEGAALKTRVLELEGKATYNIGNCHYREAESSIAKGNLEQAARSLEAAIAAYRRSLEIAPGRHEAAENLEVARIVLKGVRDEIAKYGDIQELQRRIVQALERLVAAQAALLASSEDEAVSTAKLLSGQSSARDQTGELLGMMDTLLQRLERLQGKSQQANPFSEARIHVRSSRDEQDRAVADLRTGDRIKARPPQESSLRELEKALEILTPRERQDREEQGQGQGQEQSDAGSPPPAQGELTGEQQPQPAEPEQNGPDPGQSAPSNGGGDRGGAGVAERAEDVLQEEGQNRRSRETATQGGEKPVDKDW